MNRLELIDNNIYYSIAPPIESVDSDMMDEPRIPWQGKLRIDERGVLYLHHFNPETGEIDHDSNATAMVGYRDRGDPNLYLTKAEADAAYVAAGFAYLKHLSERVTSFADKFQRSLQFQTSRPPWAIQPFLNVTSKFVL